MEALRLPGRAFLNFLTYMGQLMALLLDLGGAVRTGVWRMKLVAHQIVSIGFGSQVVVIVTGAFTGAVFTAQTYFKFKDFGVESGVGAIVSIAMCRELGPVLAGLMVTGRVGAAMAAEIGTMKVTEQIDALRAMAVHPVDYLVVPRTLAMMLSMPLLVAECVGIGIVAGYFVAIFLLEVNGTYYVANMVRWSQMRDIIMALTKAFCFALLIVFISCHKGLTAREGAVGVGQATTEAVVNASLAVLIFNFFLTMALNIIFPAGYQ